MEEVDELRGAGQIPDGRYQWVDVYELDGTNPLPKSLFNSSKDGRFGYLGRGAYGRLPNGAPS